MSFPSSRLGQRVARSLGAGVAMVSLVAGSALVLSPHASAAESWFHDPLSASQRADLVPVPAHPQGTSGARRFTAALYMTHAGALAVPVAQARGHQLVQGQAVTLDKEGLFRFDDPTPTKAGKAQVTRLAASLTTATAIRCEGYADYAGRDRRELRLSRQRSAAICSMLKDQRPGLTTTTAAYGQSHPAVIGGQRLDRQQNRRVVVLVTAAQAAPTPNAGPPPAGPTAGAPTLTQAYQNCSVTTYFFDLTLPAGTSDLTGVQYRKDSGPWLTAPSSAVTRVDADSWRVDDVAFEGGCSGSVTPQLTVRVVTANGIGAVSAPIDDFPI